MQSVILLVGAFTESEIQGVDHLVMKLRMVKFARTPEYSLSSSPETLSGSLSPWWYWR